MGYTVVELVEELTRAAKSEIAAHPAWREEPDSVDYMDGLLEHLSEVEKMPTKYGLFEEVERYGGEGQGEEYWIVWKLYDGDNTRFFKADGYYASWDGHSWDSADLFEVVPKLVTKTEFFRL